MKFGAAVGVVFLAACGVVSCQGLDAYLTEVEREALRILYEFNMNNPKDLSSVYYSLSGLQLMDRKPVDTKPICEFVNQNVDASNMESVFYASHAKRLMGNCEVSALVNIGEKVKEWFSKSGQSAQNLAYIVETAQNLGIKLDNTLLAKSLTAAIAKDGSSSGLAYAFSLAPLLSVVDATKMKTRVEDLVAQADQVGDLYLQYAEGLSVTARAVSGLITLGTHIGKSNVAAFNEEAVVKYTRFLLSRSGVQILRPAYYMFKALRDLCDNKIFVPVVISRLGSVTVSEATPGFQVKVSNVFGGAITGGKISLNVDVETKTQATALSVTPMPGDSTGTLFTVSNLYEKVGGKYGTYNVLAEVKVAAVGDTKPVSLAGAKSKFTINVLTEVGVVDAELGIGDRDLTTTPTTHKLPFPKLLPTTPNADHLSKLSITFSVKDTKAGKTFSPHQTFILFSHPESDKQIVFVADSTSTNQYKLELDLYKNLAQFEYTSGNYEVFLLIGDPHITNSMKWKMAVITISFPEKPEPTPPRLFELPQVSYERKHEIEHKFNPKEALPSPVISSVFSVCIVACLVLLLIMWLGLGVNISNFSLSLYALGFHFGLAGIFGLYFLFFLRLNMFITLKYLVGAGSITFLCGNAMLRGIAKDRKLKEQ